MCSRKTTQQTIRNSWTRLCKISIILSAIGTAQASLIPSPVLPNGTDSVRTPDGFSCNNAVAPSAYVDTGIYQEEKGMYDDPDRGVYVRLLIPITSGAERLDCARLFEQALKERQREQAMEGISASVFGD